MREESQIEFRDIRIEECPICGRLHDFKIQIFYKNDEKTEEYVFGGKQPDKPLDTKKIKITLLCPNTNKEIRYYLSDENPEHILRIEVVTINSENPTEHGSRFIRNIDFKERLLRKSLENWHVNSLSNLYSFCQFLVTLNFSILGFYIALHQLNSKSVDNIWILVGLIFGIIFYSSALFQSIKKLRVEKLEEFSQSREKRLKRGWYFIIAGTLSSSLSIIMLLLEFLRS